MKQLVTLIAILSLYTARANGGLIGVDFENGSVSTVTNWNVVGDVTSLSNLIQDNGQSTNVSLTIVGSTGRIFAETIASTRPIYSTSLEGINDFALGNTTITVTLQNLLPNESYDVWGFGLYDGASPNARQQRLTIAGSNSVSFNQDIHNNPFKLFVNGSIGSSSQTLQSYAAQVTSTDTGNLTFTVQNLALIGGEIGLAGLAVQGKFAAPVPEPSSFVLFASIGMLVFFGTGNGVRKRR